MPLHSTEHHVRTSGGSYTNKLPLANKSKSIPNSKTDSNIFSKKPSNAKL